MTAANYSTHAPKEQARWRERQLQPELKTTGMVGMMSNLTAVVVAALLPAACAISEGEQELALESVFALWSASWPEREYVVRSWEEWEAVWSEPVSVGNPRPALPAIDFSVNAVSGASIGWGWWCGEFRVKRVSRTGMDFTVKYGWTQASPGTGCVAMMRPATAFVTVAQPVGNVRFIRSDD